MFLDKMVTIFFLKVLKDFDDSIQDMKHFTIAKHCCTSNFALCNIILNPFPHMPQFVKNLRPPPTFCVT